jgi:hypothetical protein
MQIGIERVGAYDLHCAEERRPAGCTAWGIPVAESKADRFERICAPGRARAKISLSCSNRSNTIPIS